MSRPRSSRRFAAAPILYFSVEDYQQAVEGLTARERERAVLHRLDLVSGIPRRGSSDGFNEISWRQLITATLSPWREVAELVDSAE